MELITSRTIIKAFVGASLAAAFLFVGVQQANAATYVVDASGQGCGALCQQIQAYFNSQNSNQNASSTTNNNSNNGSNNGSSTNNGGNGNGNGNGNGQNQNPNYYPYQIWTPFQATQDYYARQQSYGQATSTNGGRYPYQIYTQYGSQPNPQYNNGSNGYNGGYTNYQPYPQQMYMYYGKSASTQMSQYQKPQQNPSYGSSSYGYPNQNGYPVTSGGFVMTSRSQ